MHVSVDFNKSNSKSNTSLFYIKSFILNENILQELFFLGEMSIHIFFFFMKNIYEIDVVVFFK